MNKNISDVIIIGSGIVGTSAAYYMAKAGLNVTVLEKDMIGHGASSRNGAGVRLSSRVQCEFNLARVAIREIWPTLSEELETDTEYLKSGALLMYLTEAEEPKIRAKMNMCIAQGQVGELIDGDEARKRCPYLSDLVLGAVYYPEDGHANPMKTVLGYYKMARRFGVRFVTGEEVLRINKYKGRARQVITAAGNVYEADKIIVAAGFESRAIMRTVGIHLPYLKRVDECLITEAVPRMTDLRLSTFDGNFYGNQTKHGSFLWGGNTNIERYEETDPGQPMNTTRQSPDKARMVGQLIPALKDVKVIRHWAGYLDSSADRLPIIQEIPEVPGLISASGFSGHGFAIGPAVGQLLKEMVLGEELCAPIDEFKYDRWHATGLKLPNPYPSV